MLMNFKGRLREIGSTMFEAEGLIAMPVGLKTPKDHNVDSLTPMGHRPGEFKGLRPPAPGLCSLAGDCWLLAAGCWLLAIAGGCGLWMMTIGCWQLAACLWMLAAGWWLLAAG